MGCSISVIDNNTNNRDSLIEAVKNNNEREVGRILQLRNNKQLNEVDKEGWPALHWSISFATAEMTRLLINSGISIEAKDNDGSTALHLAARFGKTEDVHLLLKRGAKVNVIDKFGRTPLHRAAKFGNVKTIRLLMNAGAIVDSEDFEGCTPLLFAVQSKRVDIIHELIEEHDAFIHNVNRSGNSPFIEVMRLFNEGGSKSSSVCNMKLIFDRRHAKNQETFAPSLQQICRKYLQIQNPEFVSSHPFHIAFLPPHLIKYIGVKC